MNSPTPYFSGVRVAQPLVLDVVFCRSLFVLFILAIIFSVLLMASDFHFGIFKDLLM
jgi:hypothetical protein